MTRFTLTLRSLGFYFRTHLGVILGTALATLVITGALFVGDSVKATLRAQAEARVGKIGEVLVTGERFMNWPADAGKRFRPLGYALKFRNDVTGALLLQGTAVRPDQQARANRVQMLGIEEPFWTLSPSAKKVPLTADEIAVNTRLAYQLQIKPGDSVILRLEKPASFSKDAPLSGEESDVISFRGTVARVLGDEDFGRFSLASGQVPPPTVFLPLATLQSKTGIGEKVNIAAGLDVPPNGTSQPSSWRRILSIFGVPRKLSASTPILIDASEWPESPQSTLANADISIRELPNGLGSEVRTSRVFLDLPIVQAARDNERAKNIHTGHDALTYFVNELRAGDGTDPNAKATPYSMVTALDAPSSGFIPAELADDEISINRWLAEDLGVDVGSKITIKYFVMGERRQLIEKSRTFSVLGPILEMNEPHLNGSWMPDFPGLADKENCRDWKPGFDFDATRMRDKDQDYWSKYRGTPKAFLNLSVGQEMWGNRWGNLTSIRYPADVPVGQIEKLGAHIDLKELGFRLIPLREQALAATNAPVDFGQLFAGFSFFLIIAAAALTGMLFTFSIEQRATEAGLLLAVGWTARDTRRLFFKEGLLLAVIGSVLGTGLAALYTQTVLRALSGVWGGATGGTSFLFAPSFATACIGVVSGIIVAMLAMWLASRRLFKMEAAALLAGAAQSDSADAMSARPTLLQRTGLVLQWFSVLAAAAALIAAPKNPILFFLVGFLLLGGGLAFCFRRLRVIAASTSDLPSSGALAERNISRRKGRTLATIGVLASGVFMVVAVDSFRKGPLDDPSRRESGTGGFTLIGESSSAIYEDLNSQRGREQYALDDRLLEGTKIVQVRVRAGDDASCLNLNRAVQPRLVGLPMAELNGRFDAAQRAEWQTLLSKSGNGAAALVDANTLQWAMQKKIGDRIEYQDDRGNPLPITIAGSFPASILQGMVIVDEATFTAKFPNNAGYNLFLIQCPQEKAEKVREHLTKQLGDRGLEIVPTSKRLADFNAVENTYLSIFQILGGLGMLLGSAGLGIVVARNVLERRREFGLLEAVGFTPKQLRSLVFAEHRWLILFAVGIGAFSAILAVWPNLMQRGSGFPLVQSLALLISMAVLGAFWTWLATRLSLRGSLLGALRDE